MKRYAVVSGALIAALTLLFVLVEAFHVPVLTDESPLGSGNELLGAAAIGVALLVIDVFLPVPSSVVMVANGALFGVLLGTVLSLIGSLGAFVVGFALGRRGTTVVTAQVPEDERQRADRYFARWGVAAIILSRPVPILAETVSFVAGTSVLGWRAALGAAIVGSLPTAAVYAVAGAMAASFATAGVVFAVVVLLAGGAALVLRPRRLVVVEGHELPPGAPPVT